MALGALLLLVLANGCAMQPPTNTNGLTGPRLVVTMTVQGNPLTGNGINPSYYYFFVINYAVTLPNQQPSPAGNKGAPGPVAVFVPNGGPTGFVASSDGSTYGYTDYVEYNSFFPFGYEYVHVAHTPTSSNQQEITQEFLGPPAQYVAPTSNQLRFTLYLTQLVQAYNTEHHITQTSDQVLAQAKSIKYLQVNFITTSSINTQPGTPKATDALGPGENSFFLNLDLSTFAGGTISNSNNTLGVNEQPGDVVAVNGASIDPSLDLIDWSITYMQQ